MTSPSFPVADHDRRRHDTSSVLAVGGWSWDLETEAVEWTDEHYRILGLAPAGLVPTILTDRDLVHEDDLAAFDRALEATVDGGTPCTVVVRIRRADGDTRHIEWVGVPTTVDNRVVSLVGTVTDVTERESGPTRLRTGHGGSTETPHPSPGTEGADLPSRVMTCSEELFGLLGTQERHRLARDVRGVVLGRDMTLRYQPIVDLGSGRITGFEALPRWQHPRLGTVPTADWMPIAEETGAIFPIGRWVMEEACKQAWQWQRQSPGAGDVAISVNLSARQLARRDVVQVVRRALDLSGLDPHLLTLEVAAAVVATGTDEAVEILRALKALGVRVSIDDIESPWSTGRLDRVPVDELKIHRSAVGLLGTESAGPDLALATVDLARSLRVDVVADGIERSGQLALLRGAGCTRGQGWLFWRPLETAAAAKLVERLSPPALPRGSAPVVLVVDDEDSLRRSFARQLTSAGYHAVEAATGVQAIDAARSTRLDAIILDVGLPDINGFEVCRRIREIAHQDLAVLHISGTAAHVEDRVRGLDLGADAYLVKPIPAAELIATVGSVLRSHCRGAGRSPETGRTPARRTHLVSGATRA